MSTTHISHQPLVAPTANAALRHASDLERQVVEDLYDAFLSNWRERDMFEARRSLAGFREAARACYGDNHPLVAAAARGGALLVQRNQIDDDLAVCIVRMRNGIDSTR